MDRIPERLRAIRPSQSNDKPGVQKGVTEGRAEHIKNIEKKIADNAELILEEETRTWTEERRKARKERKRIDSTRFTAIYSCTECGKEFERHKCKTKNVKNLFCSRKCRSDFKRIKK